MMTLRVYPLGLPVLLLGSFATYVSPSVQGEPALIHSRSYAKMPNGQGFTTPYQAGPSAVCTIAPFTPYYGAQRTAPPYNYASAYGESWNTNTDSWIFGLISVNAATPVPNPITNQPLTIQTYIKADHAGTVSLAATLNPLQLPPQMAITQNMVSSTQLQVFDSIWLQFLDSRILNNGNSIVSSAPASTPYPLGTQPIAAAPSPQTLSFNGQALPVSSGGKVALTTTLNGQSPFVCAAQSYSSSCADPYYLNYPNMYCLPGVNDGYLVCAQPFVGPIGSQPPWCLTSILFYPPHTPNPSQTTPLDVEIRGPMGCLADDTLIATTSPGAFRRIDSLRKGDRVYNPLTHALSRIDRVVRGPEFEPLVRLTVAGTPLLLTHLHPVLTHQGFIPASDIPVGKPVYVGKEWQRVTHKTLTLERRGNEVWNLVVRADSSLPQDHAFLAAGITVGDQALQAQLKQQKVLALSHRLLTPVSKTP